MLTMLLTLGGCARFSGPRDWATLAPAVGASGERVAWAAPLDGGALAVTFVAPRHLWGDARALSERLEARIEPVAAPIGTTEALWPEGLQAALEEGPEVIVLAAFRSEALAAEAVEAILERVRAGAGLVLAHYGEGMAPGLASALASLEPLEGPPDLLEASGGDLMPEWRRGLYFIEFGQLGAGRVVSLDYAGGRPLTHALLARSDAPREMTPDHRETWYGLVARAVHWAAGRQPAVRIVDIVEADAGQWDERTVPPDLPREFIQSMREASVLGPMRVFEVFLDEPAPRGLSLDWRLRAPARQSRLASATPMAIPEGATRVSVPISAVTGSFYLDARITRRGRVLDWRTEAVTLRAWPVIEEVVYSHSTLKPHDILGLRVTVPPVTTPARAVTLFVRALDGLSNADGSPRIVAQACVTAPPERGPISLDLSLIDLISPMLRVEVYASAGPCDAFGPMAMARSAFAMRVFPVRIEREDIFPLIMDGPLPAEYGLVDAYRTLAHAGVTTAHLEAGPAMLDSLAAAGLQAIPRLHEVWATRAVAGGPPDIAATTALQEAAWWTWQQGCPNAVLEAPGLLTPREALAQSPDFEERFAALRSETGAPIDGPGNALADQVALHLLADSEGVDRIALHLIEVEDAAPALRLGLALAPEDASFLRADWARIAPGLAFAGMRSERVMLRRMAAYLPASGRAYAYVGREGGEAAEAARWAWQARLAGATGLWHRGALVAGTGEGWPLLTVAGTPSAHLTALMAGVADVRQGHAALLEKALPSPAPVVLLDSRASFWLNEVDTLFPANTTLSQAAWLDLLEDLGYACRFESVDILDESSLEGAEAVVVPMARALSDSAWRILEEFASRGGHVLADVLPATHGGLGAPRDTGNVERFFGVKTRPWPEGPEARTVTLARALSGDAPAQEVLVEGLVIDPSVTAREAIAFSLDEGISAWMVHVEGGSLRVLLNHPHFLYEPLAADGASAALREWLRERLAEAGVTPTVRLVDGEALPAGTQFARYEYGDAQIWALLGSGDTRRAPRAVLNLGEKGHAYNLRTGERYSSPSRARVMLDGTQAALVSLLPYRVEGIELITPPEVEVGRRLEVVARITARDGLPGRHLLRLELATLEGAVLEHYTRHLDAGNGTLRTYVPLARNEQTGWYRLTVRDLLTGTAAEARFRVMP